ncbi:MAG: hypothetical protein QOE96_3623 [Blastocatellia bacterium]|nr:hypothetical protein [Blastocatellia bacterium]
MVERRWSHGKRSVLCSSRAESMEGATRTSRQAFWEPLIRGGPARNSTGQKQVALLVGTSYSHTRRDAAAAGDGGTALSRVDVAFVSNPDKSQAAIPSHEQVRQAWTTVNGELSKGFEKMSLPDWLQRHAAVSEEDFAKDTSRNRFAILLSRTNHLSYHLGQAVLGLK